MVELVKELEDIREREMDIRIRGKLTEMILEAKAGEYHDYKNKKYTCGKVAAYSLLEMIGTPACKALASRIMEGEFDEEADEADKEMMRKDLPEHAWPIFGLQKEKKQ